MRRSRPTRSPERFSAPPDHGDEEAAAQKWKGQPDVDGVAAPAGRLDGLEQGGALLFGEAADDFRGNPVQQHFQSAIFRHAILHTTIRMRSRHRPV